MEFVNKTERCPKFVAIVCVEEAKDFFKNLVQGIIWEAQVHWQTLKHFQDGLWHSVLAWTSTLPKYQIVFFLHLCVCG